MLPNLAAVRRPSKSAIVNSSIALIHSQRRSRIIAASELRLIKAENDALRQELNEWRQRANLPRVEEPPRSTDLMALLNLEEEIDMDEENRRAFDMHEGSYEDNDDFGEDGDEEQLSPDAAHYAPYSSQPAPLAAAIPTQKVPVTHHQAHLAAQQQQQQAVFAQQKAAMARATQAQMAVPRMIPQQQQQASNISNHLVYGDNFFSPEAFSLPSSADTQHLFGTGGIQNWSQKAIAAASTLATPPSSAHGIKPSPFASTANQAFLSNYNQQNGLGMFQPSFLGGPGSIGSEDDASSIGSSGHDGSHFSGSGSPELLGGSPIDHPFSFAVGPTNNNTANAGYQQQQQQQQRRPSVNIPAHAYLAAGSKQASPIQNGAQFAAMGLMM